MNSEIVVPETPNWLNELEAKRERRLKARLGHEAGAGAPCLKCGDKCPGLDLHFWRKACKICRCPKEEHDVPDDDIYGWAQFQLLGSKPNKIKTKITLPGKNDEVELDWAPKGHKETIDKYLKTLPPEALPVKGSQAAQERKQLLQKQIPVHDVDPALCHELNEEEVKKMEEYIAHVKKSSVGVGQIVNLSSVIKANLHSISPQEAHIIASRYTKGVPFSEIIKLQAGLAQNLEKLTIGSPKYSKNSPASLPAMHPMNTSGSIAEENLQNSLSAAKFKDITHPWYTSSSPNKGLNPQYSESFKPKEIGSEGPSHRLNDHAIDNMLLKGTNFDPSKTPSRFSGYHTFGYRPGPYGNAPNQPQDTEGYDTIRSKPSAEVAFSSNLENQSRGQCGFENPYFNQKHDQTSQKQLAEYSPVTSEQHSEAQEQKPPKSMKDLIYSTYDPSRGPIPEDHQHIEELKSPGYNPDAVFNTYKHDPSVIKHETLSLPEDDLETSNKYSSTRQGLPRFDPITGKPIIEDIRYPESKVGNSNVVSGQYYQQDRPKFGGEYIAQDPREPDLRSGSQKNVGLPKYDPVTGKPIHEDSVYPTQPGGFSQNKPIGLRRFDPVTGKYIPEDHTYPAAHPSLSSNYHQPQENITFDPKTGKYFDEDGKLIGLRRFDPGTGKYIPEDNVYPAATSIPSNFEQPQENVIFDPKTGKYLGEDGKPLVNRTRKPLEILQPGNVNIPEEYLEPHKVRIGAIQDINPDIRAATTAINPGYDEEGRADYSPDSIREILNNIKLPDCHYCKKPFEENEFAVTIDRANVLFHAQCFKCAGCNQSLADNIYFYHKETNNVYCGRDYAKIKGYPRCSACDELIFTKEYCLAENSTFHLKHFCCFQCDTPLAGQDYTLEEEKPYCLPCYETSKAAKCSTCERVIKPDEIGCQLNGVHFHAEDKCFRCIVCSVPLMGKKLLLRNEKLYCSHDCFNTGKK